MSKSIWLVSAGLFALATTPAYAQDQTTPTGEPSPTEEAGEVNPDADASPTDDTAAETDGDIVITAQGRTQILQDVPLAVSAVSAESLQNSGASDIRQLNQLAPSLLVSSTGTEANGSARIRGIGTVGDNPGLESSVAVFVDGVYRSRSGVGLNELGEIERIEVLRGPQGTLFGRNASAGLIHVISKKPNMNELEGFGSLTYGNFDYIRVDAGITGPIGDSVGFRLDGVYARRDGFYHDVNNDTDVNDRNRLFLRGQLLFEPSSALSVRLIGDYTSREEACCGAVYLDRDFNPKIGNLNEPATPLLQPGATPARTNDQGNNIINVLRDLGTPAIAFNDPFSRDIYVTPGRSYEGDTRDWGLSGEINYDLGSSATLTSITAYRNYRSGQPGDIDYSPVDILYRSENNNGVERRFKTFSQELRLQGQAFNDKLDWLVGGYFASEDLTVTDNLRFGTQYGRFATCRLLSGTGLAGFYSPGTPGCISPTGRAVISGALAPGIPSPFGAAGGTVLAAFDRLETVNDRGSTLDRYHQDSRNWALFTHNIIHITDKLALTLGLRYTNERKELDATFGNDNTACVAQQNALLPFLANPGLAPLAAGLIGLTCQGNSTSELNGVSIQDERKEDEFTGTTILSYKWSRDLMVYASASRGYKAGGFNLDRSALKNPVLPFSATPGGAQGLVGNLQFDPEINTAYELGAKFSRGPLTLNAVLFRQSFKNFQLNTFNGSVFIVQTVNGCGVNLNGGDRDQSTLPGAPNFVAPPAANPTANPAAATGACPAGEVGYGVRSEGLELEGALRARRDLNFTLGMTYANTRYRSQLVGNDSGAPLDPALRKLPGDNLSNAPEIVVTSSMSWTPRIGSSGLSGLLYIDGRMTDGYNTGSDLFPQKEQDSFAIFNARIGLRGKGERWAIEAWAQNIFNVGYTQVAFNSPFQEGARTAAFTDPQFPGGRQIFSAFLAEPRTFGLTGRFRF
ncbi:MAG TPA: TonB-dependent receptor [Allosphingosinicella sp.]|jgi:outer membrane receptor protein involved in Fe transport|nr:TonB-dependent receptor [Allosphingosinicella sp.]